MRQECLLNALHKYTLAPRCKIFGDGWAHSKSCTKLLSLRGQQWRSTNPSSPRHHGQALPALCHRSRRIFCSQLLIVLLNSNVSSPSRIFWQPYKSPLNLPTSLILRRKYKNMFFLVSWTISVVYNSHLRANIWFKQASDCYMLFIPALIIPGFPTSVFHLWYNYTFTFHLCRLISYIVYLILGMVLLQPRDITLLIKDFIWASGLAQFSCSQTHPFIEEKPLTHFSPT